MIIPHFQFKIPVNEVLTAVSQFAHRKQFTFVGVLRIVLISVYKTYLNILTMKRLFSVLSLMFLLGAVAMAQAPVKAEEAAQAVEEVQAAEGPMMKFQEETVDYGTIEWDSDPFRVFTFTNTGTEALIISNARGSCGCTVPTYPTDPILPGETGEIKVRYDTKRQGKFTKYVTLTTNAAEPTVKLMIKGEVMPKPKEESVPTNRSMFNGGNSGN